MKPLRVRFLLVALSLIVLGCGAAGGRSGLHAVARPAARDVTIDQPTVLVSNHPALGPILTDYSGRTLYICLSDIPDSRTSTVTGELVDTWPVFSTETELYSPEVTGDLDFFVVSDPEVRRRLYDEAAQGNAGIDLNYTTKSIQVTYNGWPLYYFIGDEIPGQANGLKADNFVVARP